MEWGREDVSSVIQCEGLGVLGGDRNCLLIGLIRVVV